MQTPCPECAEKDREIERLRAIEEAAIAVLSNEAVMRLAAPTDDYPNHANVLNRLRARVVE